MSWFKKEEAAPALPTLDASLPGQGGAGGAPLSPQAALMMETFKEYAQQLNNVSDVCWEKCITKKSQTDLTIGEISCEDRCVLKYLATTTAVADTFQKQMMAQGVGAPAPQQAQR